ncbi:MAG TPA: hypothetical protein VFL91_33215 [Thermomicrobiales bacterium]|nr:hypothetical protein [Thermomicrobiales bacterium]
MKRMVRRPTFWLMLGWRTAARLAARAPRDRPTGRALRRASLALEGRYWRRVRAHPFRVRWRPR